jgi:hypothetical protein
MKSEVIRKRNRKAKKTGEEEKQSIKVGISEMSSVETLPAKKEYVTAGKRARRDSDQGIPYDNEPPYVYITNENATHQSSKPKPLTIVAGTPKDSYQLQPSMGFGNVNLPQSSSRIGNQHFNLSQFGFQSQANNPPCLKEDGNSPIEFVPSFLNNAHSVDNRQTINTPIMNHSNTLMTDIMFMSRMMSTEDPLGSVSENMVNDLYGFSVEDHSKYYFGNI